MLTDEVMKKLMKKPVNMISNAYDKILELDNNNNVRDTDPSRKLIRYFDGED